jgi:hypothetical protein
MLRRRDDDKTIVSEVGLWLMKKGIPYQRYDNLSPYLKDMLRNLVCIPTSPTSPLDRKELYEKLCLPDIARDIDPDDFMQPDEEIKKIFTPLTLSERLPYLYKF